MDDDLMRLFGGDNIKNLMSKIGMEPGEPIYHPWLNKSIEKAQKKVEERNFEIRKHLLEYDDVLNQQRKYIYDQRDAILQDANLHDRVNEASGDMIQSALERYAVAQRHDQAEAVKELADYLKEKFGYLLRVDPSREAQTPEALSAAITPDLQKDIADKEALVGEAGINQFIRQQYLQMIDRNWLDHLENMEALREAVYLRGYAQKNPLTEYKIEGFQIFDAMIDSIREEIASRVHLVRIVAAGERLPGRQTLGAIQSASHGSIGAFASDGAASPAPAPVRQAGPSARSQPETATVVRTVPKVGRNDPCPCGSGKKYKFCHGR
jgi:preprotein translocase subunit SecA